jgi:hypothetical protein
MTTRLYPLCELCAEFFFVPFVFRLPFVPQGTQGISQKTQGLSQG